MGELQKELARLLAESSISMNEIEKRSNVSRSVLSRFLSGERTITIETADHILSALNVRFHVATPQDAEQE